MLNRSQHTPNRPILPKILISIYARHTSSGFIASNKESERRKKNQPATVYERAHHFIIYNFRITYRFHFMITEYILILSAIVQMSCRFVPFDHPRKRAPHVDVDMH